LRKEFDESLITDISLLIVPKVGDFGTRFK
jgi:hypothetical protein